MQILPPQAMSLVVRRISQSHKDLFSCRNFLRKERQRACFLFFINNWSVFSSKLLHITTTTIDLDVFICFVSRETMLWIFYVSRETSQLMFCVIVSRETLVSQQGCKIYEKSLIVRQNEENFCSAKNFAILSQTV